MKIKQATAAIVAAMLLAGSTAGALSTTTAELPAVQAIDSNTNAITFDEKSPYYVNLSNIIASLSIEGFFNTAYCDSSFYARTDKRAVMTTDLQRRKSSSDSWTSVKKWEDEFSSVGSHLVEHTKNVSKGYEYRNYVTVKFYSGSTVVEEVTMDSPIKTI